MAKDTLFKKMIYKLLNKKHKDYERPVINSNVKTKFYIPDSIVLQKVNNKQPLTPNEINQYFNYIYHNYYVTDANISKIGEFIGDWCKYYEDEQALNERELEARTALAQSLFEGEDFDIVYALWLSRAIYVNGDKTSDKRIIYKDDQYNLSVKTSESDYNVVLDVDRLQKELMLKTLSKNVANNL